MIRSLVAPDVLVGTSYPYTNVEYMIALLITGHNFDYYVYQTRRTLLHIIGVTGKMTWKWVHEACRREEDLETLLGIQGSVSKGGLSGERARSLAVGPRLYDAASR